jgi:cytoskeletal protein CcmA (bactofilin family)
MFGKKKETSVSSGPPVQTMGSREASFIAADCSIQGKVVSSGDVKVDGIINGHIEVEGCLTLSPTAKVNADIKARIVRIAGELHGNIQAGELTELMATACVYGDIATASFKVERGARFVGSSLGQFIDAVEGKPLGSVPSLPSGKETDQKNQ